MARIRRSIGLRWVFISVTAFSLSSDRTLPKQVVSLTDHLEAIEHQAPGLLVGSWADEDALPGALLSRLDKDERVGVPTHVRFTAESVSVAGAMPDARSVGITESRSPLAADGHNGDPAARHADSGRRGLQCRHSRHCGAGGLGMGLASAPSVTAAHEHQTNPESPCRTAGAFTCRALAHRRAHDAPTPPGRLSTSRTRSSQPQPAERTQQRSRRRAASAGGWMERGSEKGRLSAHGSSPSQEAVEPIGSRSGHVIPGFHCPCDERATPRGRRR